MKEICHRIYSSPISKNHSLKILIFITVLLFVYAFIKLTASKKNFISEQKRIITSKVLQWTKRDWKWPPDSTESVLDPTTGFYNLTWPVRIQTDSGGPRRTDSIQEYVQLLMKHFEGEKFTGSQLRQLVQMDEKLRLDPEHPNYLLYPQAIDVKPLVQAIKRGEPIDVIPINNPELLAKTIPRRVCNPNHTNPQRYDLIVLVKSCVTCFDGRQWARETYMKPELWNNFSVGFVFVVGEILYKSSLSYNYSGVKIDMQVSLPKKSPEEITKDLQVEADLFGDLLIGSFKDTYFNLTLKQMFSYRWATLFCRKLTSLLLFLDTDRSVIPENFISFIESIPVELRPNIAGGMPHTGLNIFRPRKNMTGTRWSVDKDEIPWHDYPPYPPGPGYLIGVQAVEDVSIANVFTRYFRMEDAFLGFVFQKLNRLFLRWEGFQRNGEILKEPRKVITAYNYYANGFYDWKAGKFKP